LIRAARPPVDNPLQVSLARKVVEGAATLLDLIEIQQSRLDLGRAFQQPAPFEQRAAHASGIG
jgi:hypothetical protein